MIIKDYFSLNCFSGWAKWILNFFTVENFILFSASTSFPDSYPLEYYGDANDDGEVEDNNVQIQITDSFLINFCVKLNFFRELFFLLVTINICFFGTSTNELHYRIFEILMMRDQMGSFMWCIRVAKAVKLSERLTRAVVALKEL